MQTSGAMRREKAKVRLRRMGGAKRYPSPQAPALMGIAALHPSLYGAVEVKRQAWPRTPLAAGISVSLFDRGRFFVPTAMLWSAARSRGQGWPALRGRGRRHRIQATP